MTDDLQKMMIDNVGNSSLFFKVKGDNNVVSHKKMEYGKVNLYKS